MTKLNARKPKELGLVIYVPAELARDIYRESGDLQFARFPATMTVADTIGKALTSGNKKGTKQPKPMILRRSKRPSISHEDLNTPTILTR